MAASIIGGLVASGHPAGRIRVSDPSAESLRRIREVAPVVACEDNPTAADGSDVVVLAVKPQVMAAVAPGIAGAAAGGALVMSIAAGITIDSLQRWLGADAAVVRCMPNTPALLRCGASGLFANERASARQRQHAEEIMRAVGICCWVEEESGLDAIIAVSGSGPAYFFRFMEAMIDTGEALGLDRDTATRLTLQTALGAARMGMDGGAELAELRRRVTSPGGTTQAALESFERDRLAQVVERAMHAAVDRAAEMAREMG